MAVWISGSDDPGCQIRSFDPDAEKLWWIVAFAFSFSPVLIFLDLVVLFCDGWLVSTILSYKKSKPSTIFMYTGISFGDLAVLTSVILLR